MSNWTDKSFDSWRKRTKKGILLVDIIEPNNDDFEVTGLPQQQAKAY